MLRAEREIARRWHRADAEHGPFIAWYLRVWWLAVVLLWLAWWAGWLAV